MRALDAKCMRERRTHYFTKLINTLVSIDARAAHTHTHTHMHACMDACCRRGNDLGLLLEEIYSVHTCLNGCRLQIAESVCSVTAGVTVYTTWKARVFLFNLNKISPIFCFYYQHLGN